MIIYSNEQNFENDITKTNITLVDFFATWCGPCQMLNDELVKMKEEKFNIVKVNIDENENLANRFKVDAVPMLVVFKNGQSKKTLLGYRPANDILAEIQGV